MSNASLAEFVRSLNAVKASRLALLTYAGFTLLAPFSMASAQTVNTTSKPLLVANARRYLEKGLKPATGRSGLASLTARALLGKDGRTTVEMTTGGLDGGGARPGNINKTQLKPLNENGEALYARNYTGLVGGGYFITTYRDTNP
jgi:hypothetical protein